MRAAPFSTTYEVTRGVSFSTVYDLSRLTALLVGLTALAGLVFPGALYPTEALRGSFLTNDVVNLVIGVPALLGSMALAKRDRLAGWFLWPGALLFVTYNAVAYAAAMLAAGPLMWQFAMFLALAGLSGWTAWRLLAGFDREAVRALLDGAVPQRLAGYVLVGMGGLFFLRAASQLGLALAQLAAPGAPELGTLAADLLITPLWVIGGVLLLRRRGLGYLSGAGLLFQASLLFVGLLAYFVLQPLLRGAPFAGVDFGVVAVMGLVCFVPFGLYLRGIVKREKG